MAGDLRIGMIRHGETDWNKEGRIQGSTDVPLNELGIRQAERLARRLAQVDDAWDVVYTSDLSRAWRTACIIAEALRLPAPQKDRRLREKSFGEAEGTTPEERAARWGDDWRERVRGAETDEQVVRRGTAALNDIMARHAGGNILLVTHGGWIVRMLGHLLPAVELPYIGNTSLTIIERRDGGWHPTLLGCQAHLDA